MLRNRLGFIILGLTNNFAYVIMLSAAYDLLSSPTEVIIQKQNDTVTNGTSQKFCNEHSTSTILLADSLPSLLTKLVYPFTLVGFPLRYKAGATAALSAASFLLTGLSSAKLIIFFGVISASFSCGLGEASFISNTPLYGDASLAGWSIGTGAAGLLGAGAYFVLKLFMSIKYIMLSMLCVPIAMIVSYYFIIVPVARENQDRKDQASGSPTCLAMREDVSPNGGLRQTVPAYGSQDTICSNQADSNQTVITEDGSLSQPKLDFSAKIRLLPSLVKFFGPLWLVYFAEYFINQGLFELIYYPEQKDFLDKPAQYRAFQVSYQLGVLISRSSLDIFRIKQLWTMGFLQGLNAVLLLSHVLQFIHLPSFYLVIVLIIYEGLLGGFAYVNTFYRVKKEIVAKESQEFCLSAVTLAESSGVVMAGLIAMPVHDAICKWL